VLDRQASPEQLHTLMKVTDARGWLALCGCGVLLASALGWGVLGRVPTKVPASGILIHSAGLADVVAASSGQVTALEVDVGDFVRKGDVIAQLAQPELEQEIAGLRAQLQELRLIHAKSQALGSQDVRLRSAASAQEASTLKSTILATEQRKQELQERLAAQQRLYAKGLVTKEALEATQQNLRAAEASMLGMRADIQQVAVGRFSATRENETALRQSELRMNETERQITLLTQRLEQDASVSSTHEGRVVEVRAMVGDVLAPGLPIVSLERTFAQGGLEALLYVESRSGKLVRPGMRVELAPSVARRERYGVLIGEVRAVDDFPATRRGMMRVLHNEELVQAFLTETQGAAIAVRASLQPDRKTPSGYRWSSRRGPNLKLSSGTRCNAWLTTGEERPISLVLPILGSDN
jgi:HlyD family secretion protein